MEVPVRRRVPKINLLMVPTEYKNTSETQGRGVVDFQNSDWFKVGEYVLLLWAISR